ncbi:phosphotransferase (plasmid) [Rhizobium grahamii]|uniref:Phosphotransferase n=1 Tax=Rhizobium grahamii TaxID=1120045 RepID=A0A5Q0CFG7_9HYPH|nr:MULTISPECIES: phosphotransferase [Rhizobium]QFY63224.1 phosphotransferase [Rhizobium grahamii]QRM52011.1 phosphotransferase [Rhizobium sp. BG6]
MTSVNADLHRRARQALAAFGLPAQEPELLKFRENAVFKVHLRDGQMAALRLHRPGYHSQAALKSELLWMDDLRRNGIAVPQPIATDSGDLLVQITGEESQYADLIGWVGGQQIGETGRPLCHSEREIERIYRSVGGVMAEAHNAADRWAVPTGFTRHAWNKDGLLGENPLWGRFWDCLILPVEERHFLSKLRIDLQERIDALGSLDCGLIHADLVRENVLVDGDSVALIDFDDCGYGYRLFDIATALLRNRHEPHYAALKNALIEGYRERRPLDEGALSNLPLFLLLRSVTYVGWAAARPDLPDTADRLSRYVGDVRELAIVLRNDI